MEGTTISWQKCHDNNRICKVKRNVVKVIVFFMKLNSSAFNQIIKLKVTNGFEVPGFFNFC